MDLCFAVYFLENLIVHSHYIRCLPTPRCPAPSLAFQCSRVSCHGNTTNLTHAHWWTPVPPRVSPALLLLKLQGGGFAYGLLPPSSPEPVCRSLPCGSQNQAENTENDQCYHKVIGCDKNLKWNCSLHSCAVGIAGSYMHGFPLQR